MNPAPSTFDSLRAEVFRLYAARDWTGALDLLRDADARFAAPPQIARVIYWRACFLALLGRADEAIKSLQEGLSRGVWWSPMQLRGDGDLAALQADTDFIAIVEECERRLAAHPNVPPQRLMVEPARTGRPLPLLLALHGYGGNAAETLHHWASATEQGWRVAALQSSQVASMDGYHWMDEARAVAEMSQHIAELTQGYSVDQSRIATGGFSNGSRLALTLALTTNLPIGCVVCVAGGLRAEAFDALDYDVLRARSLPRIIAIVGALDPDTSLHMQAERFIAERLPTELQRVPGLGHDYPADFGARLKAIVAQVPE
jgi:predicted esterase